ncbi:methylated-DNA--[protein]-cysteine S-methyltransferase [Chloroflexota bacterium]
MKSGLKYVTFETDMGWVGILGSARGLCHTTLPQRSAKEARQLLSIKDAAWSPHLFEDLVPRFCTYFNGRKVAFPDILDISEATLFQRRVWEVTRLIPYGNTRSYLWVAEQIGKPTAARAVGQALARNPLPIIVPCHRVLSSNGKLGGFSDGLEMKRSLLSLEAAGSPQPPEATSSPLSPAP